MFVRGSEFCYAIGELSSTKPGCIKDVLLPQQRVSVREGLLGESAGSMLSEDHIIIFITTLRH